MRGITLIGMPGAGKSTVGKILAKKLNYNFVDLDILIKEKEDCNHADILEKDGMDALLRAEEKYTLGLDFAKTVFSPGGSIIYSPKAMEKLKSDTTIFYLEMPIGKIRKCLGSGLEKRGIVGLKEKGLDELFSERTPLYQSFAHHTIDCSKMNDAKIVNLIINSKLF